VSQNSHRTTTLVSDFFDPLRETRITMYFNKCAAISASIGVSSVNHFKVVLRSLLFSAIKLVKFELLDYGVDGSESCARLLGGIADADERI